MLRTIAFAGSWFAPRLHHHDLLRRVTRKFGFQLSVGGVDLGSTRLQELEWHFHAMLFLTWIGYAYVKDSHVRIDIVTGGLSARKQAWLELFGCIVFALPYLLMALPYAHAFFMTSFFQNEGSPAPNGLPMRWIIKGVPVLRLLVGAARRHLGDVPAHRVPVRRARARRDGDAGRQHQSALGVVTCRIGSSTTSR